MSIGSNIRRLRKAHHESQKALGDALGVSSNAVSQWECNRAVPRIGLIELMAAHWRVKKSEIIDGVEESGTLIVVMTERERDLVLSYRDLNDVGRERLLEYAHDLLSTGRYMRGLGGSLEIQTA